MKQLFALTLLALCCAAALADDDGDNRRAAECRQSLTDQRYIVNSIMSGNDTFPHMRQRAANSRERLGEEHYADIVKLLDEAQDASKDEGGLQKWFDGYWHVCYDGA